MSSLLAVTVHFIGIALFSKKFSNDNTLRAVLPRIPVAVSTLDPHSATTRRVEVEKHTAIIAFPTCDYVSSSNWAPSALERVPGLLYVRLDGEQVSIFPGRTEALETSGMMERQSKDPPTETRMDEAVVGLPHLQACCPAMQVLSKQFQPPFPGAAAVVTLPSWATATACGANSKQADVNATEENRRRIDTNVIFDSPSDVIIAATKNGVTKAIRVRKEANIEIANLPTWWVDGKKEPAASTPHYHALYEMGNQSTGCPNTFDCASNYHPDQCKVESNLREMAPDPITLPGGLTLPDQSGGTLLELARIDIDCSNTQWP